VVLQHALNNLQQEAAIAVLSCKFPHWFFKEGSIEKKMYGSYFYIKKVDGRGFQLVTYRSISLNLSKKKRKSNKGIFVLLTCIS